jgi:glutathione S-transferase
MTLVFHSFPRSTATQKVRLCQHHKGITFTGEQLVDLLQFQQLDPAYLALNPLGQVPTLVVDGRPITESSIINEYLEDRFPERPLLPRDPRARAEVRMWTKYVDTGPTVQIATPTFKAWVAPAVSAHPDPEGLLALVTRAPEAVTRVRWQRSVRDEVRDDEVAAAWATIADMLARMEQRLADGPWLVGDAYTLADAETTPIVVRITHLGRADLLAGLPGVNAWFERVQALPNFAPTYAFLTA